jgi:hypothetical protein
VNLSSQNEALSANFKQLESSKVEAVAKLES